MSHSTDTSHARDALRALHGKIEKSRDAAQQAAANAASVATELHWIAKADAFSDALNIINTMEQRMLLDDIERARKGVAA